MLAQMDSTTTARKSGLHLACTTIAAEIRLDLIT